MSKGRKRWDTRVIGALLGFLVLIAALLVTYVYFYTPKAMMRLADSQFEIRIADTDKTRIQGLSGTSQLPADEAMVFVFESDDKWSIWMKDMNYPIDIVWLDESKKVVDFVTDVSPDSYPDETFAPKEEARYVVEFQSGIVKEKGIKLGQKATFSGTNKEL